MDINERQKAHIKAIAEDRGGKVLGGMLDVSPPEAMYEAAVADFLAVAFEHGLVLENRASAEEFAAMVRGYILRDLPPEIRAVLAPFFAGPAGVEQASEDVRK